MKKKEILEIIKNKKIIENSILLSLKQVCCEDNQELFDNLIKTYDEVNKQYQEDVKATQEYNEFQDSGVCDHPIRQLTYEDSDGLCAESFYECIFCGHYIPEYQNQAIWFQRRYYNECIFIKKADFQILDFLLNLLNTKDDNEEINFIEEFKKLNLDSNIFTVNDTKKFENYIIVISSTLDTRDKIPPNELIFLDKISQIKEIDILLFLGYHAKLYSSLGLSPLSKGVVCARTNKSDIYEISQKNIPLKMIINLTNNLNICDATINQELKELFPASQIINLTELNSQAIDEIANYIEKITNDSTQLDNSDNEYVKKLVR